MEPDISWYISKSMERSTHFRCPFATCKKCPRYFVSISLLHEKDHNERIKNYENLLDTWNKSEFWNENPELETHIIGWGKGNSYSNFCPEVMFERFGYFVKELTDYYDSTEQKEGDEKREHDDPSWRSRYATLTPMHYTECPVYAPLNYAPFAVGVQTKSS